MQIEKINNDKIQVIINIADLENNNIDVNAFMSNSIEHQGIFLDILDMAEKKFDFYVSNEKLAIESVSIANNIFIFTITRLSSYYNSNSTNTIYCFNSFDDIFNIISYINIMDFPFFENILLEHSKKA